MTREEAITVFKAFMDNPLFSDVHKAAFNIAIHDIKQRHDWDINNLILINKDNYESQEPKTGHWITKDGKEQGYDIGGVKTWYIQIMCSECGFIKTAIEGHTGQYHYCPDCGTKMVEPQESEGTDAL